MSAPPPIGDGLARSLVAALGVDCAAAAALAHATLARRAGTIDLSRLDGHSPSALARVANDFARRGWLSPASAAWTVGASEIPPGMPAFLDGAAAMRAWTSNEARASAVATMPLAPSAIARALPATGLAHVSLVSTQEVFERIADAATGSLTVMTPFLRACLNHVSMVRHGSGSG